ncbi:TIR domain-containing protein [Streptomyces sp. Ag109_O5-1]|uniref:toll/interleukin-1 receptor domain-containing protein n=1 Tax=Streptomyces sp. Ag109_O5-1 TaxID=1938851 RepID=UPI000F4F8549|nr:toll/interleukin-1 receptor domain-containing protein [Streptomyces sp. Ag109_O5-1]RPE39110.1 TIR domain-containing protein [Streptomyces sp. Ag109_O5-1]
MTQLAEVQNLTVPRSPAPVDDPALTSLIGRLARGPEVNVGARAPLLRLLQSTAASNAGHMFLEDCCRDFPGDAAAIRTVWNTGLLAAFLAEAAEPGLIDFDQRLGLLRVPGDALREALRQTDWATVEGELPHLNLTQDIRYDVALSFATEERPYVEPLFEALVRLGYAVFYDFNEQDRLLGVNIDEFLEDVFVRQSRFVAVVLSNAFGLRRSHCFEAEILQGKVPRQRLLPIYETAHSCSPFDSLFHHGYLWLNSTEDLATQAGKHAEIISKKIAHAVLDARHGQR